MTDQGRTANDGSAADKASVGISRRALQSDEDIATAILLVSVAMGGGRRDSDVGHLARDTEEALGDRLAARG